MRNPYLCEEEEEEGCSNDKKDNGEALFGKLLKSRTILISGEINKKLSDRVMKELLILAQESDDPIKVFINSPGGDVDAGFAIFDMMRFIKPTVKTICAGLTASAGALILLAPKPENRFSLPNARILIHQPSSGMMGDATDVEIQAREIENLKEKLNGIIADETGKTAKQVAKDTDRDNWMSPEEAKEYGLISKIVTSYEQL